MCFQPRNYKYEQERKLGKGKKIQELFASILNGKPASVGCVSSMIVVLNAKFARLLAAHANKKTGEQRRSTTRVRVLLVKTH